MSVFVSKLKSKCCIFLQLELPTLVMDINNYYPELLSFGWGGGSVDIIATGYMLGGKGFETRWGQVIMYAPNTLNCPRGHSPSSTVGSGVFSQEYKRPLF
jgi:hypothetical protein